MITRIVFQDIGGLREFSHPDYLISEQSTPLGGHTCYVVSHKDHRQKGDTTISEEVVRIIEEESEDEPNDWNSEEEPE